MTNKTEFDWSSFKVRCSAISDVLSDSKSNPALTEKQEKKLALYRKEVDAGKMLSPKQYADLLYLSGKEGNKSKLVLSDSCVSYLMTEYAWITEGMIPVSKEQLNLVAAKKGNMTELSGISLLIQIDKLEYKIHKDRIYNEFLSGQIDAYVGEEVMKAIIIADNKSSWDYPTYLVKLHKPIEREHDYQVKGYMDITGAQAGFISHTLVDCPEGLIEDARWALTRKLNAATPESPEVLEEWPKWVRSMKFSHMPVHKRVHKITVNPFTKPEQQKLYDKVKVCRDWLSDFHEKFQKKNL
jgi:hypothetical protein